MSKRFPDQLIRGIEYLRLPAEFPQHHFLLEKLVFTNRPLVHELSRLTAHKAWFRSMDFKTVVDVGAYLGAFAFAMRVMLPKVQLYCFDPLAENIGQIKKNLNKWGKLNVFQTALGNQRGMVQFNLNDFRASSSMLEMDLKHKHEFPNTVHTRKIDVPMAFLDDFLPKIKFIRPMLLKIDVQGYELDVLEGASKILSLVDHLILEVSYQKLYEKQPLFDDIYKYLGKRGFEFAGNMDSLFSPKNGLILQSDALFIRRAAV
jgi:FkbM family methyltransferase